MDHIAVQSVNSSNSSYKPISQTAPKSKSRMTQTDEDAAHAAHLTQAYRNFRGRLDYRYLICEDILDIAEVERKFQMIPGNISRRQQDIYCGLAVLLSPCLCAGPAYYFSQERFTVESNSFAFVEDQSGDKRKTKIFGPGYHFLSRYHKLLGKYSFSKQYENNLIKSPVGDLQIAIVEQGTIMHFELGGQNIILGPGIHAIWDPLEFKQTVPLDTFYIEIGPEKWVAIPEGYDGIAVDLGRMRILSGGHQHHLPYSGFTFSKLVPKTLLTDRIPTDIPAYIKTLHNNKNSTRPNPQSFDPSVLLRTTTAEGAEVCLDAMVFWRIIDTMVAATTAMELLKLEDDDPTHNHIHTPYQAGKLTSSSQYTSQQHIQRASKNIDHLRETVLRIVKHHLTAKVGQCSLAGNASLGVKAKESGPRDVRGELVPPPSYPQSKDLNESVGFSFEMLQILHNQQDAVKVLINAELIAIGVEIQNICIYSVTPTKAIQQQLDKQTEARVLANTAMIDAKAKTDVARYEVETLREKEVGKANANKQATEIHAMAEAEKLAIVSKAEAESIRCIAEAREKEAKALDSETARELARIRESGEAAMKFNQGNKSSTYYFGDNPLSLLMSMFQNPNAGALPGGKKST